jgi:DNA-binding NtrC family response regulator
MHPTIEVKVSFDPENSSYRELKNAVVQAFERQFLKLALERFEGNLSAAATALKTDRKHLHDMCKKHGLR